MAGFSVRGPRTGMYYRQRVRKWPGPRDRNNGFIEAYREDILLHPGDTGGVEDDGNESGGTVLSRGEATIDTPTLAWSSCNHQMRSNEVFGSLGLPRTQPF